MSRFHKAWYEEVHIRGEAKWLVWQWLPKWHRYVNTHMYDNRTDAKLTIK